MEVVRVRVLNLEYKGERGKKVTGEAQHDPNISKNRNFFTWNSGCPAPASGSHRKEMSVDLAVCLSSLY